MVSTSPAVASAWQRTGLFRSSDLKPAGSAAQAMSPADATTTRDGSATGCAPWKKRLGGAGAGSTGPDTGTGIDGDAGADPVSPTRPVAAVATASVVPTARRRRRRWTP